MAGARSGAWRRAPVPPTRSLCVWAAQCAAGLRLAGTLASRRPRARRRLPMFRYKEYTAAHWRGGSRGWPRRDWHCSGRWLLALSRVTDRRRAHPW